MDSKNKLSQENTETIGIKIYNAESLKNDSMIIREDVAKRIKNTVLRALLKENKTVFYHLYGQIGIDKKTLTRQVPRFLGKDLMIVDLELFIDEYVDKWKDKFLQIIDKNKNPEVVLVRITNRDLGNPSINAGSSQHKCLQLYAFDLKKQIF